LGEPQSSEGEGVESCEGLGVSFAILDEPSEAGCPCEGSLHPPAAGQEDEAALGLRQFDDLESEAMPGGGFPGALARAALIDPGDLEAALGDALALPGLSRASLPTSPRSSALAGATWRTRRWPSVSSATWTCDPFLRLAPSCPARSPLSGVDRRVRLSRIATLGSAARPAASRSATRRSSTRALKHPAASQRRACWRTAGQGGRAFGLHRQGAPVFRM